MCMKFFLFIQLFYYSITRCRESGLYNEWLDNTLMSRREGIKKFIKDFNDKEPIVQFNVLNIDHLTDSFIIMLIGIILSILVLIIECLYLYFNYKRAILN